MAILTPSLGSCAARMTPGEHRLAERLEQKLGDDYLPWYDVALGGRPSRANFLVLHPRRGLLILEVRDWSLKTIRRADQHYWQLFAERTLTTRPNPAEMARQHAQAVVNALLRDAQLAEPGGEQAARLRFPWSYGVVFPELTRQEFSDARLERFIEPQRVLCSDEMLESVEPKALQSRLWGMFPFMMGGVMTPQMLERVRWILFPELRLAQEAPFDDSDPQAELPERMAVMELAQERLMRSQGDGGQTLTSGTIDGWRF